MRVVAEENFVNYGNASDQYGHGTHIVSLARGNGRIANAAYVGITRRGLQLKLGRYAMSATSSV